MYRFLFQQCIFHTSKTCINYINKSLWQILCNTWFHNDFTFILHSYILHFILPSICNIDLQLGYKSSNFIPLNPKMSKDGYVIFNLLCNIHCVTFTMEHSSCDIQNDNMQIRAGETRSRYDKINATHNLLLLNTTLFLITKLLAVP